MKVFGSNAIKQGIKSTPPINFDEHNEYDKDEYEEYIDPECGCRRIRIKKIKNDEDKTDVTI